MNTELIKWDKIKAEIVQCQDIVKLTKLSYSVETVQKWGKQSGQSLETQNEIAEYRLRLDRKRGQWIEENVPKKGGGSAKQPAKIGRLIPTLKNAGINRHDSPKLRIIASMPEKKFEKHIVGIKKKKTELTTKSLLNVAKKDKKEKRIVELNEREIISTLLKNNQCDVIVIDPPWKYSQRKNDPTHRAANPYPDMDIDEIMKLSVNEYAAKNCVLWLWTTNAFLHSAFHIVESWGFVHKTILTWEKDKIGLGDWLRGKTEHCIMAIKGKPTVNLTDQTTIVKGLSREHSRKPDEFYELVKTLCPGIRLDWFSREKRIGFEQIGKEADKF